MDEAFRVGDDLVFNLDDDVEITVLGARRGDFEGSDFLL